MPQSNYVLRDPTSEGESTARSRRSMPEDPANAVIALLSIAKERSNEFLDGMARELTGAGYKVRRYQKPTHTKPAPETLLQDITADCDIVIEALAD